MFHVADGVPAPADGDDESKETTPVLSQHYHGPLQTAKAATVATGAKLRAASCRLTIAGGKGPARNGVRVEASRKIAFAPTASLIPAVPAVFARPLPCSLPTTTCAGSLLHGRPGAVVQPTADTPMFLSHSHVLQRRLQAASPKSAPPPVSPLVSQLLMPSRDRRRVAVSLVWCGGGDAVFLVGSFTGWRERVPMAATEGGAFFVTIHLRAGAYQYAFEVNGQLCIDDEETTCATAALPTCSATVAFPPAVPASPAGAPAAECGPLPLQTANALLVDDGAEFEEEEEEQGAVPPLAPPGKAAPPAAAGWHAGDGSIGAPPPRSSAPTAAPSAAAATPFQGARRAGTHSDGACFSQEVPDAAIEAAALSRASRAGLSGCGGCGGGGLGRWAGAAPPLLPPHLARLHGVPLSAQARCARARAREGAPVEWSCELEHAGFAVAAQPAPEGGGDKRVRARDEWAEALEADRQEERRGSDDEYDGGADGCGGAGTCGHSDADGTANSVGMRSASVSPPDDDRRAAASDVPFRSSAAPRLGASARVSVTWRWRAVHRVTTVLYSPAPAASLPSAGARGMAARREAEVREAAGAQTTSSSTSLPIRIPRPFVPPLGVRTAGVPLAIPLSLHLSLAAAAAAAASQRRPAPSRVPSDISMGAAARSLSTPASPTSPAPAPGMELDMELGIDLGTPAGGGAGGLCGAGGADGRHVMPIGGFLGALYAQPHGQGGGAHPPPGNCSGGASPPFVPFGWMLPHLDACDWQPH